MRGFRVTTPLKTVLDILATGKIEDKLVQQAVNELYGRNIISENEGRFDMFDKVLGSSKIRELFMQNLKVEDILSYLNKDVENFRTLSKKYYLYK